MATISIADNDARKQYTQAVTANSTQLTIDFPFFSLDDINVIVTNTSGVDTTLSRGTGTGTFAVTGAAVDDGFSGGDITLGDTYPSGTKFTIFRDITIERTTDFPVNGTFDITALNTELDKAVAIFSDNKDQITRSIRLTDGDDTTPTLSVPATRANKILSFDGSGNVSVSSQPIAGGVTVSTLSPGASATASYNTSTGVLALGIPQGATGATGAAGADGADGTGTFDSFTISDGSTTQTITDGNTLTFTAGTNMQVAVSATDTVTITNTAPDPVALAIALG